MTLRVGLYSNTVKEMQTFINQKKPEWEESERVAENAAVRLRAVRVPSNSANSLRPSERLSLFLLLLSVLQHSTRPPRARRAFATIAIRTAPTRKKVHTSFQFIEEERRERKVKREREVCGTHLQRLPHLHNGVVLSVELVTVRENELHIREKLVWIFVATRFKSFLYIFYYDPFQNFEYVWANSSYSS